MSGISVRTLHFYDEVGLLKPAFYRTNGYRFYEEAQLLMLQQILSYRELGFDLSQIKQTLGRGDSERTAALQSHREILQKNKTNTLQALLVEPTKGVFYMRTYTFVYKTTAQLGRVTDDERRTCCREYAKEQAS
jgi:MerR family transcriptional regulator, thiopeptide resistance regulator